MTYNCWFNLLFSKAINNKILIKEYLLHTEICWGYKYMYLHEDEQKDCFQFYSCLLIYLTSPFTNQIKSLWHNKTHSML